MINFILSSKKFLLSSCTEPDFSVWQSALIHGSELRSEIITFKLYVKYVKIYVVT